MRLLQRLSICFSLILSLVIFAASPPKTYAEPFDSGYGNGGSVLTPLIMAGGTRPFALQPDGKALVSGAVATNNYRSMAVTRYNVDGSVDTSFGTNGIFSHDFGYFSAVESGLSVQSDGKILVLGYTTDTNNDNRILLGRLNTDGSLDTSYGNNGLSEQYINDSRPQAMTLQPDNKVVAVAGVPTGSGYDFLTLRFNTDGTFDNSFGTAGKVQHHYGTNLNLPHSVLVQPDGKVIVSGSDGGSSQDDSYLIRYNSDGAVDTTFGGGNGYVSEDYAQFMGGETVDLQPDGKIVMGGIIGQESPRIIKTFVFRYNADGSHDTSFANNGAFIETYGTNSSGVQTVKVLASGKIMIAGSDSANGHTTSALRRLNANGTIDTTFGTNGSIVNDFGVDSTYNHILDLNGKILVGGWNYVDGGRSLLAQYAVNSTQVTALTPAQAWIGLKNSDDVGTKFDLLAQAYKDSTLIASGQLNAFNGGSSGFNNAHVATIPFDSFTPVDFPTGSQLKLTLSVRTACNVAGHNSGTARLWFNDTQANSQFGTTIGGATNTYYLRDGFTLATTPGTGPKKTIDVAAGTKCSPFKPFGTWTATP